MYPLEFKDKPEFNLNRNWTYAVDPQEIKGTIVLLANNCCLSGTSLVRFDGEPENVDQVFLANWIGDRLTLKTARGQYLEYDNGWSCHSRAVSERGMFSVLGEFEFTSTHKLEIENCSTFQVLVEYSEPDVEVPTSQELEQKVGKPLSQSQLLELYRAASHNKLHDAIAKMRDLEGSRV